mgnify:CR=1 FL=1
MLGLLVGRQELGEALEQKIRFFGVGGGAAFRDGDFGEAKAGRVEFRLDKTANIHVPIGKVNFTPEQLMDNLSALVDAVNRAKPTGAKGIYVKRMTLTSTMAPGIRLDPHAASSMRATAA